MCGNLRKTSDKNRNRTFYVLADYDQTKSRNMKFQDFVRLLERSVQKSSISIFIWFCALKLILGQSDVRLFKN